MECFYKIETRTGYTAGEKPGRYIAEAYLLWLARAIVFASLFLDLGENIELLD